jgi:hypothetical protein
MTIDAMPLFGGTGLVERIERVETQLITAATEAAGRRTGATPFVIPIAGGAACYAEDGSPLNKAVGLGFGVFRTARLSTRSSGRCQRAQPPRRSNSPALRIPPSAQP